MRTPLALLKQARFDYGTSSLFGNGLQELLLARGIDDTGTAAAYRERADRLCTGIERYSHPGINTL